MSRVELLAPCGSYDAFLAAVNAGADAVYLAGPKFGARAYAQNFSSEQLVTVIRQAHEAGVKVYLTLNTLLRDDEMREVVSFLAPFVEAGLDGIIVQDLGVCHLIRQHFPTLALHISTQMSISSSYGAQYAKSLGAVRVVPSRELTLQEIKQIKQDTGMELETFIHGAMCYCYSGQCLMSSFIGGRSGNRGRCAQPCRLPYHLKGKDKDAYYLSLKDMYTLEMIPELIEAGIDSFKVEGRMKRPEYVAGVISVYRKYIDLYEHDPVHFKVEEADRDLLANLYLRSETGEGYYHKIHGKDMVTLNNPGYLDKSEEVLHDLRIRYVHPIAKAKQRTVDLFLYAQVGEAMVLTASVDNSDATVSLTGEVIPEAQKAPATNDSVIEHLSKFGDSQFALGNIEVSLGDRCFIPVKWINQLRRDVLAALEQELLTEGAVYPKSVDPATISTDHESTDSKVVSDVCEPQIDLAQDDLSEAYTETSDQDPQDDLNTLSQAITSDGTLGLSVAVMRMTQLEAMLRYLSEMEYLILDDRLLMDHLVEIRDMNLPVSILAVRLPRVIRGKDRDYLHELTKAMKNLGIRTIVVPNADGLLCAQKALIDGSGSIIADASLYHWNTDAIEQTSDLIDRFTLPLELNSRQIRDLMHDLQSTGIRTVPEAVIYGRAPMMVSANCVRLTDGTCQGRSNHSIDDPISIIDRKDTVFPVYTNCRQCFNIIYNSVPTALYDDLYMLLQDGVTHFRLEYTVESGSDAAKITELYLDALHHPGRRSLRSQIRDTATYALMQNTTSGHFRRGVM